MKKTFFLAAISALLIMVGCSNTSKTNATNEPAATVQADNPPVTTASMKQATDVEGGKVIQIGKQDFLKQIYNYEANPGAWVYEGSKPAIIDFYADWCGPCKRVAPIMAELAAEYKDDILVYKVDTDKERELAQAFGIRSIPSILFIPASGQPQMVAGALPKAEFEKLVRDVLKVEKN